MVFKCHLKIGIFPSRDQHSSSRDPLLPGRSTALKGDSFTSHLFLERLKENLPKECTRLLWRLCFISAPRLCCPAAQAGALLFIRHQRSSWCWKSGQLLCHSFSLSNYSIAQQDTHGDPRSITCGAKPPLLTAGSKEGLRIVS